MTVNELKDVYKREHMGEEQDTAAWMCNAIGESGVVEHLLLLAKATVKTPCVKI